MKKNQKNNTNRPCMTCADIEHLLDCYLDGEMLPSGRAAFEVHLRQCPECERLLHECEFISQSAKLLADEPIPQMVSLRLRQVLREEVGHHLAGSPARLTVVK